MRGHRTPPPPTTAPAPAAAPRSQLPHHQDGALGTRPEVSVTNTMASNVKKAGLLLTSFTQRESFPHLCDAVCRPCLPCSVPGSLVQEPLGNGTGWGDGGHLCLFISPLGAASSAHLLLFPLPRKEKQGLKAAPAGAASLSNPSVSGELLARGRPRGGSQLCRDAFIGTCRTTGRGLAGPGPPRGSCSLEAGSARSSERGACVSHCFFSFYFFCFLVFKQIAAESFTETGS